MIEFTRCGCKSRRPFYTGVAQWIINEGEADGWVETDMAFNGFESSLISLLEEYVEANKEVIFD